MAIANSHFQQFIEVFGGSHVMMSLLVHLRFIQRVFVAAIGLWHVSYQAEGSVDFRRTQCSYLRGVHYNKNVCMAWVNGDLPLGLLTPAPCVDQVVSSSRHSVPY